jgi:hypothetical protein
MKKVSEVKRKSKNNKPISDQDLFKRASHFKTRGALAKGDRGAYTLLHRRGLLDEACVNMVDGALSGENHPQFKHTDKSIAKKAAKCETKKEFKQRYPSEYILAHNRGIFSKITKHMIDSNPAGETHSNSKYSNEELSVIARNCKTISELIETHYDVYKILRNRKLFKKFTSHMPLMIGENHPHAKYKNSEIIQKGSTYRTQVEFMRNDPNSYKIAWKRKLLEKIDFIDGPYVNTSVMERDILELVKSIYPLSKKLKDRRVKIEGKSFIKGFDIDVFIPQLNLGIEVDGEWWHSFECMREQKGKKLWSDEDIRNYHEIKDAWFATKGIKILHIKEEDWLEDKQACIDRCLAFLGVNLERAA